MLPQNLPFVLTDDARSCGRQVVHHGLIDAIVAHRPEDVRPALERVRIAAAGGAALAGYLAYEAGHAIEPKLAPLAAPGTPGAPLVWFGSFAHVEALAPGAIDALLPDAAGAWAGAPRPRIDRAMYDAAVARLLALIAAGDIYQANLSYRADVPIAGDPLAIYARLRRAAGAGWGALVHDGRRWLLSFSPELFFRIDGRRVAARPMKGTAPRGADGREDAAIARALAADPKQRAENLMIVDLMRNDLARIARPGSVRVTELFAVETYPTVQQMVSQVEAELAPGHDAVDVLATLFPCGSITGAPKLRAMEVIAEVEEDARGPYTGAIGTIGSHGSAAFNVAIRTLSIEGGRASIGLGSAIVADSTAAAEWAECRAKAAFVTAGQRAFDLIETIRFDPFRDVGDIERHLARLAASAAALGFAFDRRTVRDAIQAATIGLAAPSRVRLRLAPGGAVAIETAPCPASPTGEVAVAIVPLPVAPEDFRLVHKTSDRGFYDAARAAAGTFEVLFRHPSGVLAEGSFTSLFVPRADGRLTTPPGALGLLPGILRARLIDEGRAIEGEVAEADLAGGFLIGNALRGLLPARLA